MVYIVTSFDKIIGSTYMFDAEAYFDEIKDDVINHPLYKRVIKNIDNAIPTVADGIKTPFGNTVISNLSTGCKTLLIAVYDISRWINFLEAGPNVLKEAIAISKDTGLDIHCVIPCNMPMIALDEKVIINNELTTIRNFIVSKE